MVGHVGLLAGRELALLVGLDGIGYLAGNPGNNLNPGGGQHAVGVGPTVAGKHGGDAFIDNHLGGGDTRPPGGHGAGVLQGLELTGIRIGDDE